MRALGIHVVLPLPRRRKRFCKGRESAIVSLTPFAKHIDKLSHKLPLILGRLGALS